MDKMSVWGEEFGGFLKQKDCTTFNGSQAGI